MKYRTSKLQEQIMQIIREKKVDGYTIYPRTIFELLLERFDYTNKRTLSASLSRALKTLEKQARIKLVRSLWNDKEQNLKRKKRNYYNEKYYSIELLNANTRDSRKSADSKIKVNSQSVKQLANRFKKEGGGGR